MYYGDQLGTLTEEERGGSVYLIGKVFQFGAVFPHQSASLVCFLRPGNKSIDPDWMVVRLRADGSKWHPQYCEKKAEHESHIQFPG